MNLTNYSTERRKVTSLGYAYVIVCNLNGFPTPRAYITWPNERLPGETLLSSQQQRHNQGSASYLALFHILQRASGVKNVSMSWRHYGSFQYVITLWRIDHSIFHWTHPRPMPQIPQCTCPISHNAPFRTEMCIAPSQWETALLCNDVSHWLGAKDISVLNGPLWDMGQVHCGICESHQQGTYSMTHQALCIITSSYANSNCSYGPETAEYGFGLCELIFDLWPCPFAWASLLSMVITPENFMMGT